MEEGLSNSNPFEQAPEKREDANKQQCPRAEVCSLLKRQNKKVTVDFSGAMLDVIRGNEIGESVEARACTVTSKTDFYFGFYSV